MDYETAEKLFLEGGTLIIQDVPYGTEFGVDYNSWNIGEKFKGVKMIPPGFHFVYYAAVGSSGQTAPRTGFFHYFKQKEIVVKKWDPKTEDVIDKDMSEEDLEGLRNDLQNLDQYLGSYPYESLKKWVSLTNHVNINLMRRIEPECRRISSITDVTQERVGPYTTEASNSNVMAASCDTTVKFTPILLRQFPTGVPAKDITKLGMDKSAVLENILLDLKDVNEILGELQLAFVTFLVGQVYDAFEQWKKLIHLLCSCVEAVDRHPDLFETFIGVIHFQLLETPQDFFIDIVARNNFLVDNLHRFFITIQDASVPTKLQRKSQKFKQYLTKRFSWDFDQEPEEDAPVVLEI